MQITDLGLEFITIANLVSLFYWLFWFFLSSYLLYLVFSFYKNLTVGYSFLIFQNPRITTLLALEKEKKARIAENLQIVIAEPEKDIQRVYSLNIKTLNLKDDRVMLVDSGKKARRNFWKYNKKQSEKKNDEQQQIWWYACYLGHAS